MRSSPESFPIECGQLCQSDLCSLNTSCSFISLWVCLCLLKEPSNG